jgi:hypothetical protein
MLVGYARVSTQEQDPLACPGRGCAGPDDQGGAGGGPPRSRPGPLRSPTPQRSCTLPAVPGCTTGPNSGGEFASQKAIARPPASVRRKGTRQLILTSEHR